MSNINQHVHISSLGAIATESAGGIADSCDNLSLAHSLSVNSKADGVVSVLDNGRDITKCSVVVGHNPSARDEILKNIFDNLMPDVGYKERFIAKIIRKYGVEHFLAIGDARLHSIIFNIASNSMYMAPEMMHCREVYEPAILRALRSDYHRHKNDNSGEA